MHPDARDSCPERDGLSGRVRSLDGDAGAVDRCRRRPERPSDVKKEGRSRIACLRAATVDDDAAGRRDAAVDPRSPSPRRPACRASRRRASDDGRPALDRDLGESQIGDRNQSGG